MAIYRLLQRSAFGQEDIDCVSKAYEHCLQQLGIDDRSDPITEKIARNVIEVAQTGVRDPLAISGRVLAALGFTKAD
jgi:uncharacterized protein